jgi:hypothetical protein
MTTFFNYEPELFDRRASCRISPPIVDNIILICGTGNTLHRAITVAKAGLRSSVYHPEFNTPGGITCCRWTSPPRCPAAVPGAILGAEPRPDAPEPQPARGPQANVTGSPAISNFFAPIKGVSMSEDRAQDKSVKPLGSKLGRTAARRA